VQRCSPICNAFLDWRTRDTRCGWVGIFGLGIRDGPGPGTGVGGVAAVVGGDCTLLVGEWTGSGEDMDVWVVPRRGSYFYIWNRSLTRIIDSETCLF
jgi:hypothetical protein